MKKRLVFIVGLIIAFVIAGIAYAGTTGTGSITATSGGAAGGGIADVAFASSGLPSWNPIQGSSSDIVDGDLYTLDTTGANPFSGDIFVTLYLQNGDELAGSYSYFNQLVTIHMLSSQVVGEAVGTGDSSTTTFTLANAPVAPTTLAVYLNGSPQTEGSSADYIVNYKTGVITFTSAPGNTVAVTANYWYNNPSSGAAYKQAPTSRGDDIPDTLLTLSNGFITFVVAGDSGGAKYKVVVEDGALYTIDDSGTLSPSYFLDVKQG